MDKRIIGGAATRRGALAGIAATGAVWSRGAKAADFRVAGTLERIDPALDALIDPSSPVELVFDGAVWAEGPVWVGDASGFLLWSDPRDNVIRRWNAQDGASEWLRPSGWQGPPDPGLGEPGTNGLALGRGGVIYADSGSRTVGVLDLKTRKKTVLASHYEGKRFNSPNDLVLREDGMIYFTDPPFGLKDRMTSTLREMDYTGVFRIAPDNTLTLVDKTLLPNGIGLSPDGRTLYVTDVQGWVALALDAAGNPVGKRLFVGQMRGDGLRVDTNGNVWASTRSGLTIFTPQGKKIGVIHGDDPTIANCEFGADGHLYMTNNHRIIRIKVKAKKLLWPVARKA